MRRLDKSHNFRLLGITSAGIPKGSPVGGFVVLLPRHLSKEQPTWCDSRPFPDQLGGKREESKSRAGTERAVPRYETGLDGT